MTAPAVETLLDVRDVARLLNVTVARVYYLVETRDESLKIPHLRIGRLLRFRPADVERWVAERVS